MLPFGRMQGEVRESGGGFGGLQLDKVKVGGSTTVIDAVFVTEGLATARAVSVTVSDADKLLGGV